MSLRRELRTERLRLRQFGERDVPEYARICADAETMRFMGGTLTPDDAWRQVAAFLGHWQLRGYGLFAVEERAGGRLIGRIGLWNPQGWPGLEIGWLLARERWGQGLAAEGARAVMALAREELGAGHLISVIHPQNERSIRLAERLGGRREGQTALHGVEVAIFGYGLASSPQTST